MYELKEDDVYLKPAAEITHPPLPAHHVCVDSLCTEEPLEGAVLEACVRVRDKYLVFMTDDIPFEDTLHVYLLGEDLAQVDSFTLGAPYSTGSFQDLNLAGPGKVSFRFMGDTTWTVSILNQRKFHVPFVSGPKGINWRNPFFHYLEVQGSPRPA